MAARLLQVSTDFVFNGQQGSPYRPEQAGNPLGGPGGGLPALLQWSDAGAASWYDVAIAVGELAQLFLAGLLGDAPSAGSACAALAAGAAAVAGGRGMSSTAKQLGHLWAV